MLVKDPCNLKSYAGKIAAKLGLDSVSIDICTNNSDGSCSYDWRDATDAYYLRKASYEGGARFRVKNDETGHDISNFNLQQMPACCGISVLTNSWVDFHYRNRGIATLLNQMQKDIARWNGFTVLLCTDVATNAPQKKVLQRNGWVDLWRFQNKRTDNHVDISVVDLDAMRKGRSLNGESSHPMNKTVVLNLGYLRDGLSWFSSRLLTFV